METDAKVMEMVEKQLRRSSPPSNEALYGRAARINSEIRELSLRQFHARYPLQVKRKRALREKSGQPSARRRGPEEEPGPRGPAADRSVSAADRARAHIRDILFRYARAVASAEDKAQLIEIFSEAEAYAMRVLDGPSDS